MSQFGYKPMVVCTMGDGYSWSPTKRRNIKEAIASSHGLFQQIGKI